MTDYARRAFLKLAGATLATAAVLPFADLVRLYATTAATAGPDVTGSPVPLSNPARIVTPSTAAGSPAPASLGRVANWGVYIREEAKQSSKLLRTAKWDDVLPLFEQVAGDAVTSYNDVWYKTDGGYVYSAWVQPVENNLNPVEPAQGEFWGEISVPFSDSRWSPNPVAGRSFRLYYTSVYRVVETVMGKDDKPWYRLKDGITWSPGPYVPAAHVRRIDPSELAPLSPGVPKRVEVNIAAQTITAFESDIPVFTSRIASGYGQNYTPYGSHHVLFKCPSSRMTGGETDEFYDLPGVPFPTYFTARAAGIHGAYWHNDFGYPRSHGCVNVPAPAARWFWRWTEPFAPYETAQYNTPRGVTGTEIRVA